VLSSVHLETVFLSDTGVAPLPKNAHVPTYAPLFQRSRALVSNKNPRFRMGTIYFSVEKPETLRMINFDDSEPETWINRKSQGAARFNSGTLKQKTVIG
jgi:hypothetical protein